MMAGVLAIFLMGCGSAEEPAAWAADDPQRPMMVAVAPADAARVEAAAANCGLNDQRRLTRGNMTWIVMRDVLARDSEGDERVACLARWAMANQQTRVMFFGRTNAPQASPRQ